MMEQQGPSFTETLDTELDRLKAAALSALPFEIAKALTPLDLCTLQLQLSSMRVLRSAEHPMVVLNQVHLWAHLTGHVLQMMEQAAQAQAQQAAAKEEPEPEKEPEPEPKKNFFRKLAEHVTT